MNKLFVKIIFTALCVTFSIFKNYAALTVVNLGTTQTVAAAITANSASLTGATNVLFVVPDAYTGQAGANTDLTGLPSSVKAVTFRGASANSTMKTNQINVSSSNALDSLNLRRLTLFGVDDGTSVGTVYLFYPGASTNVGAFTVDSCTIKNYYGAFRFANGTHRNFQVNHSIFRNLGGYGFCTYPLANASGTPANISVNNSTFYDVQASMFYLKYATYTTVNINNCTFDNIQGSSANFYYNNNLAGNYLNISNCLFGKVITTATGVSGTFASAYSVSNSYYTSDWATSSPITGLSAYSGASTALFTNPTIYNSTTLTSSTVGDYTIKDSGFTGNTSCGDPRWYYIAGSTTYDLTTSVSPSGTGTVSQSTTYNAGTIVTATATKSVFGYVFKEWQNESGILVSTNNPYTFTINANTTLVAVFQPITTYNFTVNKAGAGANWGSVTVSPAPTGGKEETGATVTMTPVSNIVSTFSHWDDASTGAKTVNVSGDASYTATFTANPFIVAWDFPTISVVKDRVADYYSNSSNQSVMRLLLDDGITSENWTFNSIGGKYGMKRWTSASNLNGGACRSFQLEVSTKGFKNINVNSKVLFRNTNVNKIQNLMYSTDGIAFTNIATLDLSGLTVDTWYNLNATIPSAADNKSIIYIRWIGDVTSGLLATATGTEEFHLTDVVVSGTPLISSSVSGDLIATTSGDMATASNWSVAGNAGWGITGTASGAPSASDNVWIPNGVVMSNAASASVNNLTINGAITANAALNVNGNIALKSDINGSGTLLDNGNLNISGTSSAEIFLPTARSWYIASPFASASAPFTNVSAYFEYIEAGNNSVLDVIGSTAYWKGYSNNLTLESGKGYIANVTAPATLNLTGTFTTGNKSIALSRMGATKSGFNLVGNPYPSYLNWMDIIDALNSGTSNVMTTIWYRTKDSQSTPQYVFDTFNQTANVGTNNNGTGAVTGKIPPFQAFWVRVASGQTSGNLALNNTMRSHQDIAHNKLRTRAVLDKSMLRLQVSNGNSKDETIILFHPEAVSALDNFDSPKMSNNNIKIAELFTQVNGENLVINGLSANSSDIEIPLGFSTGIAGIFTINASELLNFNEFMSIQLVDYKTDSIVDLLKTPNYTFNSEVDNSVSRFAIRFKSTDTTTNLLNGNVNCSVVNIENGFRVLTDNVNTNCKVYNEAGQLVKSIKLASNQTDILLNQNGFYIVHVSNGISEIVKKIVVD